MKPEYFWSHERIERELLELHADQDHFLTHHEFRELGKRRLYVQLCTEGVAHWAAFIGKPRRGSTWQQLIGWEEATERATSVIAEHGYLPGINALRSFGQVPLASFIRQVAGSRERLLAEMGYQPDDVAGLLRPIQPRTRSAWSEQRVRDELLELTAGLEVFPTEREFVALGRYNLYRHVVTLGGMDHWAAETGLPRRRS